MPFQSIEPRRLYRQIDQIRTLIRSGEFTPGSRLRPKRDLAPRRPETARLRTSSGYHGTSGVASPSGGSSILTIRRNCGEHRAVLKSIAAHDAAGGRLAMQRRLDQAYKRFSKDWNARQ